jgi:hypothetical protein
LKWPIFKQKKGCATISLGLNYCSMGSSQPPFRDSVPFYCGVLYTASNQILYPHFESQLRCHLNSIGGSKDVSSRLIYVAGT